MSSIGSPSPFFIAGTKSYEIERSLRFNRNDNSYLSRTPSSAGNRKTWTYSVWFKLGQNGVNSSTDPGNGLFLSCGAGSTAANMALRITNNGYIGIDYYGVGGFYSSYRFRDPSAWYHFVWVMDTTESTAANRMKVYVNGDLCYNNSMNLSQNADTPINNNSLTTIGVYPYNTSHGYRLDGLLTEVNFLDGFAYDPSYFAETSTTTGQWIPKKYTGSYGTNGFYLNFSDNTNNAAIGTDYSGNSNNFTTNNIASSHDTIIDTPTLNFATLDPLSEANGAYSQGNLKTVGASDPFTSTMGFASGKFYYEAYVDATSNVYVGVIPIDYGLNPARTGNWQHGAIAYRSSGQQYKLKAGGGSSSVSASYGASYTAGDIIGVAVDIDNDTVTFYKNGSSQGNTSDGVSYMSVSPKTTSIYGAIVYANGGNNTFRVNFGQDSTFQGTVSAGGYKDANGIGDFKYTVPTGFLALCSENLPNPTIKKGDKYFDSLFYTGTGSTQSITGLDFSPDFVWIKKRNQAAFHQLFDTVRGATYGLFSNSTNAQFQDSGNLQSFTSDGFTADGFNGTNASGGTYAAWNWDAGDSTATNNDGSITTQVRANTTAGFSIVTYTGNNASATIGHGLGVAPKCVILKRTNGTGDWIIGHDSLASNAFASNKFLKFTTSTTFTNSLVWGSQPTSSVVQIVTGSGATNLNGSGDTYVAYCFSEVSGYSKFGSYVGNGSSNGIFVHTGFRPAFVMVKSTTASEHWNIPVDVNFKNGVDKTVSPNLNNDERDMSGGDAMDFMSNGFKIRNNDNNYSNNNDTFIYLAFAKAPFKYARAR